MRSGDARLFVHLFKGKFCFDHAEQQWYRWNGTFWKRDSIRAVIASVEEVVDLYEKEATRHATKKRKAAKAGRGDTESHRLEKQLLKRIRDLHTLHRRLQVLKLACSGENSLGISGEQWDRNPNILACANGVAELDSGLFRPGDPEDYIRTVSPTDWEGIDASAPAWVKFLREVFDGDGELVQYVQRLLGSAISGEVRDHIFPIFWGRGRNGKTTLFEVLQHVLGPLAGPIQPEMLLEQRWKRSSASPSPDIMALRGRRLVWTSETGEGRHFDLGKIKRLVGGDTLCGRYPFGRIEITFRPTHTLVLLTNHRPGAPADDYAFWQRVHLIPFSLSFVDNPAHSDERRRDPDLLNKLKQEAPGILAWLVRGNLYSRYRGLNPPDTVRDATEAYRAEEDSVGQFISARCHSNPEEKLERGRFIVLTANGARKMAYKPYPHRNSQRECSRILLATIQVDIESMWELLSLVP
jgi:putative DNA primase/helicase